MNNKSWINILKINTVFFIGVIFYCYEFFLRLLTGAYQQQIIDYFHINTHICFSFLISSYNLTYLLMQIPAGLLLDKYGSKKILIIATLMCGLGNILFVLDGYALALFGRLLIGIGSSFAFIGVLKLSRETLPNKYFGLFASIVISLGTLAAAFSQQVSVFLAKYDIAWNHMFIYVGLIALPLSILFYLFIPKSAFNVKLMPTQFIIGLTMKLIKDRKIWLNAIWAGLIYIPTVVLTSQYGVYYFQTIYASSAYAGTQLITMLLLGWVVFSPIVVLLMNATHKLKSLVSICGLLMLGFLIIINFMPIMAHNHLFIYVFLFGVFSSVQVIVWQFFSKICSVEVSGVGIAVTNMIITGVTELGQLASGVVLDIVDRNRDLYQYIGLDYNVQFMGLLFILCVIFGFGLLLRFIQKYI